MEEEVFFENSNGDKIAGILTDTDETYTHPVVIMCHGLTMNKDILFFRKMQDYLFEENIASFRIDFFGHGESEGKFEQVTITEAVDDILQAIAFLKKKGYQKIGLLGSSFGGNTCLLAAGKLPDLFCLALRCPVANYADAEYPLPVWPSLAEWEKAGSIEYRGWLGKKTMIPWSFAADLKNHDGYAIAKTVDTPTLIIHGDADTTVPVQQSEKLAPLLKNGVLEIVPGANHMFSNPDNFKKMFLLLADFIVDQAQN